MSCYHRRLIETIVAMLTVAGCASELPYERSVKTAVAVEEVDLSLVRFTDVASGDEVEVAAYMDERKLDYVLLLFGSVGCSKCNEKARTLSGSYLNEHPLFLERERYRFEMIGVNTDIGTAYQRFQSIMLSDDQRAEYGYGFVRWADPRGTTMMQYLVEDGSRFGVPFTVLLTRSGVAWRFDNKDSYEVGDLLERALATIERRSLDTKPEQAIKPEIQTPVDLKGFSQLGFISAQRFDQFRFSDCQGKKAALPTKEGYDVHLIQVSRGNCRAGDACFQNQKVLDAARIACEGAGQKRCYASQISETRSAELCASNGVTQLVSAAAVAEFYKVFGSLFNWTYDPAVNEWGVPTSLAEVGGPLVFAFANDGTMRFAAEGVVSDQSVIDAAVSAVAPRHNWGINYPVFSRSGASYAETPLDRIFSRAKYTVVASFDRYCGSCIEELSHWSAELYEYCASSNGFCQVIALESELAPTNTPQGRGELYESIMQEYFEPSGIRIPLFIDPNSFGDGFSRMFSAYFTPMFPQWQGVFGSVIYDGEGKIRAEFKSATEPGSDPVFETLKQLRTVP